MRSALAVLALAAVPAIAQEKLDYQMLGKIREEGLQRSQVMETLSWLRSSIGPCAPASRCWCSQALLWC